jgi:putative ABC transport system permease protein
MRLVDQFRSVRHTFDSNRGRVALTLLGIMIGAGSIVLLASLLKGGEEALVSTNQGATDADLVRVDPDEPATKDLQKTRRELNQGDTEQVAQSPILPDVQVTSERVRWTKAIRGKQKKQISLVASEPIAVNLYKLDIDRGRFISDEDLRERKRVAVVGINVWRELLEEPQSLDNMTVMVDNVEWSVVGVLKNKPGLGGSSQGPWMWNNKVLVPRTTFDATFFNQHQVDRVFVRVGAGLGSLDARLNAGRNAIEGTLLRRHYGVHNFKVDRRAKDKAQEKLIFDVIEALLLGTGLLSLFVGGINIMNIMLVTVTERTREIGVRRAIGANPTSIMMQFLLESAVIALAGGLIGVLGGVFLAWATATLLTKMLGNWNLHIEMWAIALGLGLSVTTGVIFGMFPAWRAARLDPVEALRYE